jgi:hypothetical protein
VFAQKIPYFNRDGTKYLFDFFSFQIWLFVLFTKLCKGPPNPNSTHIVYMMNILSQETIISNAYFARWSLSNFPLGSSTLILLNN